MERYLVPGTGTTVRHHTVLLFANTHYNVLRQLIGLHNRTLRSYRFLLYKKHNLTSYVLSSRCYVEGLRGASNRMQLRRTTLLFGGSLANFIYSIKSFPFHPARNICSTKMPVTRRQAGRKSLGISLVTVSAMSHITPNGARRSLTKLLERTVKSEEISSSNTRKTSQGENGVGSRSDAKDPSTPDTNKDISTAKISRKRKTKIEPDSIDLVTQDIRKQGKVPSPKSPRKLKPEPGSVKPPNGWEDIYSLVEELRQDKSAPVDADGGESLPQRDLGDKVYRFQVLVALMLSSQTKDAVVGEAIRNLQKHGLTVENISETSPEKLDELIRRVGFHNNKTKYIKEVVEVLISKYDGDIPSNAQEMMTLAGVGPKMAFIVENIAWNKCSGIGVDTHMHRMFNDLNWVSSKNPEQTRIQLEAWLPKDKWTTINYLWVGFGQEVQQFKPKMLQKALECSRPLEALKLIKQLGLDYRKEAAKLGIEEKINEVLSSRTISVKLE